MPEDIIVSILNLTQIKFGKSDQTSGNLMIHNHKYVCWFEYLGKECGVEIDDPNDVQNGFWINIKKKGGLASFCLSEKEDGDLWIPPSKVNYIISGNK
jgi:hypothetical protein